MSDGRAKVFGMPDLALDVHPVDSARWDDLERLFGPRGAVSGCWCMWWRLRGKDFRATGAEEHRAALCDRSGSAPSPGLLGYRAGEPVGWVSLGPRSEFDRVRHSSRWKPADDEPVWSVVCFVVHLSARGQGVGEQLLAAAVDYARSAGAAVLEAYPKDTAGERAYAGNLWMGTLGMFTRAGFTEVERREPTWPIMRLDLAP